ncbi:MAG: restriction endonuclease subunit S [Chitinophagales bacterium]|nr:restriction endonuclease subunit S [Chitinophagales bacterium]
MIFQLQQVAALQFGLYENPVPTGDIIYLQGINLVTELRHHSFNTFLPVDKVSPNHILQKNDILIASKGVSNKAIKYDGSFGPAVASSLFFIVKPDISQVLPDYLTIFLNDIKTQNLLKSLAGTTTVPHISKKDLAEITIPIPSIEKQKRIIVFIQHWQREKQITKQLLQKKEQFYSSLFNQLIQK